MKLSIIIPIYNVEAYLEDTIKTILQQTFNDFELILIDDGSMDRSGEICDAFSDTDNRIRVIHKENAGVSEARNDGVRTAKGEYIGFIDSDDIIEPCMYELMINAAEEYDCDIVQCEHDRENKLSYNDYKVIEGENFEVNTGDKVVRDIFIKTGGRCTNVLSLCSKIYKRHLFDGIHFPTGKVFEDEARTYQILLKTNRVGEIDLPLYHYVKRDNSIITGIDIKKRMDKAWVFKDRMEFFRDKDEWLFKKSVLAYLQFLKATYVEMFTGILIYTNEDEKIIQLLRDDYKDFFYVADKYTRLYMFLVTHNILNKYIAKNDFEPIQRLFRCIKEHCAQYKND